MDFNSIKNKVITIWSTAKNKVVNTKDKAVNYSAKKLVNSSSTIKDKRVLLETIKKSKNSSSVDKKTWKRKTHKKRAFIIFASERSSFFKDALFQYPILKTKAFSQNVTLSLATSNIEWIDYKAYNISKFPSLVVFENQKVIRTIEWKEKIEKLVKSFNLDINEELENL